LTSALSLCSTVPILYLMARELQRHLLPVLLPGLLAAGALPISRWIQPQLVASNWNR